MLQLIFFHYLMLNVLLVLGYTGTILLRKFSVAHRISFKQELKTTHFLLVYIPSIYSIILLLKYYFIPEHSFLFKLPDIGSTMASLQGNPLPSGIIHRFSLGEYFYATLLVLLITAAAFKTINFIRQLIQLKHIIVHGILIKRHHHLSILLSDAIHTPFCFSFLTRSYVVITNELLENYPNYQLAIQHELQHLRQKDTAWLYLFELFKIIFYFNPPVHYWLRHTSELQELTCDEALIKEKLISPQAYANCLLTAAEQALNKKTSPKETFSAVIGLFHSKRSLTSRRITMLTQYKKTLPKRSLIFLMSAFISLIIASTSYAVEITTSYQKKPLDQPLYTDNEIINWSKEAALKSFTYDYTNYKQKQESISHDFTADSWKKYMLALKNSGNIDAVVAKQLSFSAVSKNIPQIIDQGIKNDKYIWHVKIPLNVTYSGSNQPPVEQAVIVDLMITRTNETANGIAISEYWVLQP